MKNENTFNIRRHIEFSHHFEFGGFAKNFVSIEQR
jgi:hypothetical protein